MRTMTFQRKIQRIPESVCPAFTKPAERTSVRDTIQRRRSTVIDADNELDGVFEWFTGASYRLARSCSAGLEFWNHHEFADATVHEHSAYFVGPTIHYEGQRWFATLGFLHQLPIGQAFSHENKEFVAHDGYILGDEHENIMCG